MRINLRKKKNLTDEQLEIISTKDFFDRTVPGIIKFYTDHYICGNFYKSCWAVTEYPTSTEETAILAHLADRNGVTLRIMLMKLYARFGIDDFTDFNMLNSEDYPIMSDLYELIEKEFMAFDNEKKHLYTEEMLQNICLGLHSMCKGAESKYFNGHTNIGDGEFICFGVKGLMDTNKRLKDTLLFNILSYMSNQLLGKGNTVAAIDELYLFLTNMTAIEYIRNGMKRVRKRESSFILASQNIEDFLLPEIKEFTKPLFSIPSHHFLFNPGNISPTAFIDTLQLEESEYGLIKYPERGTCLYRCGNERYLLQVIAPQYKAAMFGNGGGR